MADALGTAAADKGLVIYQISPANSTNVFVTLPDTASENSLTDLSSLAPVAGDLILGAPAECPDQPFCLPGLKDVYGIEFGELKPLDQGGKKTVAAIDNGLVDVAELFSLDPTITDKGYTVLTDDLNLQANGNFVPLVREEVATDELGRCSTASRPRSPTTTCVRWWVRSYEQRDVADVARGVPAGREPAPRVDALRRAGPRARPPARHHPLERATPLKGPTTSGVIHPP